MSCQPLPETKGRGIFQRIFQYSLCFAYADVTLQPGHSAYTAHAKTDVVPVLRAYDRATLCQPSFTNQQHPASTEKASVRQAIARERD